MDRLEPSPATSGTMLKFPLPFRTLQEALQSAPPDQPFVTMWKNEDDIQRVTFGEFAALASAQATFLQAQGVKAGDRVILIMPQGIAVMAAFAGAMQLGAIPAMLAYPNFKVEPAKYRFGLAGTSANLKARLIVVDEEFPQELAQHISLGDDTRLVRSPATTAAASPANGFRAVDPDEVAFIQHSAGTTGLQKGVALSHAAVLRQINHLGPALELSSQDCIYSWLPLYHDMGLIACFILPLVCHLPVVMQSPTDWVMQPGSMLQLISEYRCTLGWVPNFTLQFLARRVPERDRSEYDLSSLRMLINCSEPVRAASIDEFLSAYRNSNLPPHVLQSSYAMAETVFAVTQSATNGELDPARVWVEPNSLRRSQVCEVPADTPGALCLVSSGQCLAGTEVRIVSDQGQDLTPGHVGEIWIRSDAMLNGYYNRPDLTAKALSDGWYRSGDLGFQWDRELYVTGRKKDLIIVAGENLYPQDVEEIVSGHAEIQDGRVVAFGFCNAELGTEQIIVVAEVRKEESLSRKQAIEAQLRTSIAAELGVAARAIYLKPPRWIVKSTAGKPARSTTREKLISEHPELQPGQGDLTGVGSSATNN